MSGFGGLFDLVSGDESGGQNVLNTEGSSASGYFQITNGTWQQFAPQAGYSLSDYPTAMSAPASVQQGVASIIPLSRWATLGKITQQAADQGYTVDPNATLGQNEEAFEAGGGSGASPVAALPTGGSDSGGGGLLSSIGGALVRVAIGALGIGVILVGLWALKNNELPSVSMPEVKL